jgi:hypothetical protein
MPSVEDGMDAFFFALDGALLDSALDVALNAAHLSSCGCCFGIWDSGHLERRAQPFQGDCPSSTGLNDSMSRAPAGP